MFGVSVSVYVCACVHVRGCMCMCVRMCVCICDHDTQSHHNCDELKVSVRFLSLVRNTTKTSLPGLSKIANKAFPNGYIGHSKGCIKVIREVSSI